MDKDFEKNTSDSPKKVENIVEKMSDNKKNNQQNDKKVNFEQTARLRVIKSEDIESTRKGKKVSNKMTRKPMKMSSIYKKKYLILWLTVLFVFIIAYQFVKVKDIDFIKLDNVVSKKIDFTTVEKGDDLTLRKLYGISKIEIDRYLLYAPKSNMDANEILVLKCKPEYVDSIMNRIQNRVDSQSKSFKNYAPAQYEILSKSELSKKGDYIYFISHKDVNVINNAIKNSYK